MPSRRQKSRVTGLAASAGILLAHGSAAAGFDGSSNVAIYWGQNSYDKSSGPLAQQTLATYCANTDIDIIPMAFLVQITSGEGGQPVINFANQGNNCTLFTGTELLNCPAIGDDIKTCQQKYNKTILLSIGGATYTEGGFASKDAAVAAANLVWDTFGPASGSALTASSSASAASSTVSTTSAGKDATAVATTSMNASTTVAPVLSATLANNLTTSALAANLSTSTDPFAWTGDAEVLTISTEFVTTFTSFFSNVAATAAETSEKSSKTAKSDKAATTTDDSSTSATTTAATDASPTTSDTSAVSSTTAKAGDAATSTSTASDDSSSTTATSSESTTSTADGSSATSTTSAAEATTSSTSAKADDATTNSAAATTSKSTGKEETLSYDTTHIHRRATTALRPFGDAVLDGFDLDLESVVQNFNPFAKQLRTLMDAETSKKYYLTAAPQCPYPDASDKSMLNGDTDEPAVPFDAIWVQFYNNYCGVQSYTANSTKQNDFNFDTWNTWATTVSANKDVKVFVGVPAGQTAAGSGYTAPSGLAPIIAYCKTFSSFGGIMAWDASQAYANTGFLKGVKSALGTATSSSNSTSTSTSTSTGTSTSTSKRQVRRIVKKEWWG